jgi:predicted RNA-binding protein with PUA-like domain
MAYWIVKSEPTEYSYAQLSKDARTAWTGIRNFTARNNLRAMKAGELALFFHTGKEKAVVGIAQVLSEAEPDPTANGEDFSKVDLGPHQPLKRAVSLKELKAQPKLKGMSILKIGRLSVGAVSTAEWKTILAMAAKKPAEKPRK